jgi:hypothetical protein
MESCVPNIGPRERARRLLFGLLSLAGAVGLAFVLADARLTLRALVLLPLLAAGYGVFQFLEKT